MPPTSVQDEYALNLKCPLGVAVYLPIPVKGLSGSVGDVAFFHPDGKYECICNVLDSEVYLMSLFA